MSDNVLDTEIYPDNDDVLGCAPTLTQFNATTGVLETVPLLGLTGGIAFLSLTKATDDTSVTIHADLSVPLTQITGTNQYAGALSGTLKTLRLAAIADGTILYRHFKFGRQYHESAKVKFKTTRVAAPTPVA